VPQSENSLVTRTKWHPGGNLQAVIEESTLGGAARLLRKTRLEIKNIESRACVYYLPCTLAELSKVYENNTVLSIPGIARIRDESVQGNASDDRMIHTSVKSMRTTLLRCSSYEKQRI